MRKLARKYGILWVVLAIFPTPTLIGITGKLLKVDPTLSSISQLPILILQTFATFIVIKYFDEIL